MLSKVARKTFSSLQPSSQGKFNIFSALNRLKTAVKAPIKHFKRGTEASPVNYSPMTNTTEEAFDEVSQEWQALVVGNAHDVNTYNMLEQVAHANFGTVDNPHVIFTSDAPFRYVGCTGPPNEDDYEGHEFQVFMLREGSMQRCASCGQVFKLVRLRDQFSPDQDYYLSNFLPYDMQEMAEMDTTILMNPAKMNTHHEYTQFETPSNMVYSLINPDEHDRMLTDPAFRLERTQQMEQRLRVYIESLRQVEREFVANFGPLPRHAMNKVDYTTLIEVEKAVNKMDRLFRKVDKFNNRKYLDPENHERREQRLQSATKNRWDNNYAFFYGGLTEEEQKYRDYFQTDCEKYPEDEKIEEQIDEHEILSRDDYKLDRYDFQEAYTRAPEDDQSSQIEKKVFKFKYRMARDTTENYVRRNSRMLSRHLERYEQSDAKNLLNELSQATLEENDGVREQLTQKWADYMTSEAVKQYQDYFESDSEEDFSLLQNAQNFDKNQLLLMFENVVQARNDNKGFVTLPKRKRDNSFGIWQNFTYDLNEFRNFVAPKAKSITKAAIAQSIEPVQVDQVKAFYSLQDTKKIERK